MLCETPYNAKYDGVSTLTEWSGKGCTLYTSYQDFRIGGFLYLKYYFKCALNLIPIDMYYCIFYK